MSETGRVAIIINPTKFDDLDAVKASAAAVTQAEGWPDPVWYETTVEDPGEGQAKQAVEDGATLVCACGGDGTVRSVASGLRGTEVPMGLLPAGTGNLLARNLVLPIDDLGEALRVALTGQTQKIDVGEVTWDNDRTDVFLVMCGVGLDGEVMAEADDAVKAKVGWVAYVLSGMKAITRRGFRVRVVADGSAQMSKHARSVLVGNCGELTAGTQMMPDAVIDDGKLDVALLSPRGILSWTALLARVLTRNRSGHPSLQRVQAEVIEVYLTKPKEGELDGDPVGTIRRMSCRVHHGVLAVRVKPEDLQAAS